MDAFRRAWVSFGVKTLSPVAQPALMLPGLMLTMMATVVLTATVMLTPRSAIGAGSSSSTEADATPHIVLENFSGPRARPIRASVAKGLMRGGRRVVYVSPKTVLRTARRLRANLKTPEGYARVAEALHVTAWVSARVVAKRGWQASIQIVRGADGEALPPVSVESKSSAGLAGAVTEAVWTSLSDLAASDAPEAEPPMSPDDGLATGGAPSKPWSPGGSEGGSSEGGGATSSTGDGGGTPSDAGGVGRSSSKDSKATAYTRVETRLGLLVFSRKLTYSGDVAGVLRPYSLKLGLAPRLEARIYPGAFFAQGVLQHIGLTLAGEIALGLTSKNVEGTEFPTSALAFDVGLVGRLPLGAHDVSLAASFGQQVYAIDVADGGAVPGVPKVSYSFLRLGLDGRFELAETFFVRVGLGYRLMLGLGEISEASWFPRASGSGLDARVSGGMLWSPSLGAELGIEFRRYGVATNAVSGDTPEAESAADLYLGATLALLWQL